MTNFSLLKKKGTVEFTALEYNESTLIQYIVHESFYKRKKTLNGSLYCNFLTYPF